MKKKVNFKVIIILLIVLLVLGFIIYKFVMLQQYKTENIVIENENIFNETIEIEYNQNENVVSFEEMSYFDYFSDYVDKENTSFKVRYDENGEVSSFYSIVKEKQYIYLLNTNSFKLATDKNDNIDYSTEKDINEFLIENEIKDDIDLIKYVKKNYYLNNNLLTAVKIMKKNYIINEFAQQTIPNFKNITLIKSEKIKGYIINKSVENSKEIRLLHNDNQYIINLSGNEITNTEFVKNLLESISFN